jgi:hypothetical protein
MKKIVSVVFLVAWWVLVLVLGFKFLNANRVVYYLVTVPLLIIPTGIIKRFCTYKKVVV